MEYDKYNREERYLCAHLFRLLHEWAKLDGEDPKLIQFLRKSGLKHPEVEVSNIKIFFEVALIRDAYFARKPDVSKFMDQLVKTVALQEGIRNFTSFGQLPEILRDPARTHPKQILQKAEDEGIKMLGDDSRLYGAIQGIFNAKPDLAITLPNAIISYEAKFTQAFNLAQMARTRRIAEVWSKLLFQDLGFDHPPNVYTATIGPKRADPYISWEWLFDRTIETYSSEDRTYVAMENAVHLLSENLAG